MKDDRPVSGGVHQPLPHDSAPLHVAGEARYVDDVPEPAGTLHAAIGMSAHAHARITGIDVSREMLDKVVKALQKNKEQIGGEIRTALDKKNTLGMCAKSGHPLLIRRSKVGKRFVGCSGWPNCDVTFPLPHS